MKPVGRLMSMFFGSLHWQWSPSSGPRGIRPSRRCSGRDGHRPGSGRTGCKVHEFRAAWAGPAPIAERRGDRERGPPSPRQGAVPSSAFSLSTVRSTIALPPALCVLLLVARLWRCARLSCAASWRSSGTLPALPRFGIRAVRGIAAAPSCPRRGTRQPLRSPAEGGRTGIHRRSARRRS